MGHSMKTLCPTCGGAGQIAIDRSAMELSNDRSGTGMVRQACPTCDDEGWLDDAGAFA